MSATTPATAPEPSPLGDTPDEKVAKRRHSPTSALIAVAVAIVASVLMGYSFLTGLDLSVAAEGDPGSSLYIALFFIAVGLAIVSVVIGVIGLLRRAHRLLSILALVLVVAGALTVLVIAAGLYL
jgi:hypothetical protein